MFGLFSSKAKPAASQVAYTLRSALQIHGKELQQVQYATENYVATEVNNKLILFRADTNDRYAVSRATRELKRIDLSQQILQAKQFRAVLGEVVPVEAGQEEVDGYACERFTMAAETPQIVISGDFCRARVPGLERTALGRERALDAEVQPFAIRLEPDQLVVRSSMKILAAGAEQNQSTRLVSVEERIDGLEEMDSILTFKITG